MSRLAKWRRKARLAAFRRADPERLAALGERRAVRAFRRAAARVPAYRALLAERGIDPRRVRDIAAFRRLCPVLDKKTTFGRHALRELVQPGALERLAAVRTSSGRGGSFAFGLAGRAQARAGRAMIDLALEHTFAVDRRRTLLINCLPMGVRFAADSVTVAEVSVREDMALALAAEFGPYHDQLIVVGDPLFLKRLADVAAARGFDWRGLRPNVIVGEEAFGERYRDYLAARLGLDADDPEGGLIGSSLGIGEIGLNLLYETRGSIVLRRRAARDPAFAEALFGAATGAPPMLFAYNPLRTLVEVLEPGADGYGDLVLTLNDRDAPLPLLRYRTGDLARLVAPVERPPLDRPDLPLVALRGRAEERLPDGGQVLDYKDALYADRAAARCLSGAFRLEWTGDGPRMHLQLGPDAASADGLAERLARVLPATLGTRRLIFWRYAEFPFGMGLDYERKFDYLAAAE